MGSYTSPRQPSRFREASVTRRRVLWVFLKPVLSFPSQSGRHRPYEEHLAVCRVCDYRWFLTHPNGQRIPGRYRG